MRKSDAIVQFSGLESGKYEYHYTLGSDFFSEFENEELRDGDVDFRVVLEKTERSMMFTFSFSGSVRSFCDRCLGEMDVPVSGEEHLCIKLSNDERCDNEDMFILPENASRIDLSQWMYEYVVVSLPMRKVHEDGQCDSEMLRYIEQPSSEVSESEAVDPRWSVLEKLKG